ncbi:sterile alpha motif domain-containing protein 3-like isoform X2 [Sinocyclocheilus grahami]|uniref:sterile alpha motif domain-containing protein 3-like isoform X2 n=1 Tax=Sinocyclocheilus grahami TaxID=75366 RepID=UPI0007AD4F02|nr:PREDICTED: sterile alpha motif domain-containing protein 3-like isoform X2 [Sinocyclocheilus grahami]
MHVCVFIYFFCFQLVHMSLRRKFKWERAPLVDNSEVRGSKEKFGHKKSNQLVKTARTSQRNVSKAPSVLGEDPSSIEAHVNVLHSQHQKMQPDLRIVRDRMQQTFAWRQKEIADGMTVEDALKKYPFLRTPTGILTLGQPSSFCLTSSRRTLIALLHLERYVLLAKISFVHLHNTKYT